MSALPLDFTPFVQYGLIGLVLAWFMWRNEKVLTKLIETQDTLTKSVIVACETIKNAANKET